MVTLTESTEEYIHVTAGSAQDDVASMPEHCIDVTVVICTRNRAASLGRVLRSMAALKVPARLRWELLVVDNGSQDDTPAVIASYGDQLPIVRLEEATPGLSNARNAGIRRAHGRYIVWTDDDVQLHEEWLAAYVEAFQQFPDAAVFGGTALPILEEPTPAWFLEGQDELRGLLAHRDPRDFPRRLAVDGELPYGLNFAVRTAEQRSHLYDPALGVAPGRRGGGEERQSIQAMLAAGADGYWVPKAIVFHVIPPSRQTLEYVKLYYKAQGEVNAFLRELDGTKFGVPTLFNRGARATAHYLLYLLRRVTDGSAIWVRHFRRFSYEIGVIAYLTSSDRRSRQR